MKKIKSLRIEEEKWEQLGKIADSMRMTRAAFIELVMDFMEGAEKVPFAELVEKNIINVLVQNIQKGKGSLKAKN